MAKGVLTSFFLVHLTSRCIGYNNVLKRHLLTPLNGLSENLRFWTKRISLDSNITTSMTLTGNILEKMRSEGLDVAKIEMGMVIVPSTNEIIPIHDGMLQSQHQQEYSKADDNNLQDVLLCGFSRRASTNAVNPMDEERPINLDRVRALDIALDQFGITKEDLLSAEMAGTPAARAYRSFIAPRPQATYILEPIERAANRTAAQIELGLRQTRADQAAYYLRNNDKPLNSERATFPVVFVLDNVRSAFNVGSLFRTAETGGIEELITVGITAHPPHPKLRKTAMSSVDVVPSRHFDDVMEAILDLKSKGYTIVALETTSKSKCYTEVEYPRKLALVLGNEVTGVDTRVMDMADIIVEIPTFGIKNSLNVASAGPVVLFEVLRKWTMSPHSQGVA